MLWLGLMGWSIIGLVAGLVGVAEALVLLFAWGAASAKSSIEDWAGREAAKGARRDAQGRELDERGIPYL